MVKFLMKCNQAFLCVPEKYLLTPFLVKKKVEVRTPFQHYLKKKDDDHDDYCSNSAFFRTPVSFDCVILCAL
jgi:hypothetical protein